MPFPHTFQIARTMSRVRRWVTKTARFVHLYATLLGLALIFFFAMSGFMLNHIEWFLPDEPRIDRETRVLPLDKLPEHKLPAPGAPTGDQKLAIVETLRREFAIAGELWSFDNEGDAEIVVSFRRAGGESEARIQRDTALVSFERKSQGWMIVLTDLHRGNRGNMTNEPKFTGVVWMWVIDLTCLLLLVICVTGTILWWTLKGRGKWGAIVILFGMASTFAAYQWFVP